MADGGAFAAQWFCKNCVSDLTGKPFLNFARRATCRECGKPKSAVALPGPGGKAGGKGSGGGGKGGKGGGGGSGGRGGGAPAAAAKLYADQRAKEAKDTALAKENAALRAKVAELKAKEGAGTCPTSAQATSVEVGGGEEGEDQGGDLLESIAQKEKDLKSLEAVLAGGPSEGLQRVVDERRAALQDLRDKRRSGKPVATQLRDIDARIKRKTEQLGKKDKALEALQRDRDEVEKKRAELDRKEELVVKEKEETRAALESLQAQRAQVEQLVAPEVQEAASQRKRDNDARLQEILGWMEEAGNAKADMLQGLRQMVADNNAADYSGAQHANSMETDEPDTVPGLDGDDLDDEDFNSDDDAAIGLGITPTVDKAQERGRSRIAERDRSERRSRSASRRRKLASDRPAEGEGGHT